MNLCYVASVVSDSLQPCRLQAIRLLCSWGFSRQEYWSVLICPPPEVFSCIQLIITTEQLKWQSTKAGALQSHFMVIWEVSLLYLIISNPLKFIILMKIHQFIDRQVDRYSYFKQSQFSIKDFQVLLEVVYHIQLNIDILLKFTLMFYEILTMDHQESIIS